MHLPDGLIPLDQVVIYWIISLIALAMFFVRLSEDTNQKDKRIVLTAVLTAATIIASSISIPSPFGIPMHFFIIPLVVIILGPFNGILVTFLSLLIQTLIGLGGLTVLGANVFVLGVVLCLATYITYTFISRLNENIAVFIGTVMGIVLATIAHIAILILAGLANLEMLLLTLVPFYLFIGIMEGFVTAFIVQFIEKIKPELLLMDKI